MTFQNTRFFILGSILLAASVIPAVDDDCSVRVQVVDTTGKPVDAGSYEFSMKPADGQPVIFDASDERNLIACGVHELRVRSKNKPHLSYFRLGRVIIKGPSDFRVTMSPGGFFDGAPPTTIKGVVNGLTTEATPTVRLLPLITNMTEPRDILLSETGEFEFRDINPGRYLVVYFDGPTIVAVQHAQVWFSSTAALDPVDWPPSDSSSTCCSFDPADDPGSGQDSRPEDGSLQD